jgi:tellurite resistance protein TehA-like permease
MATAAAANSPGLSVRDLPPNAFALAMATGIVSLAANGAGIPAVAYVLFWLNAVLYPVLWVLLLARAARHPDRLAADLRDHARAPGFFTAVAGSCIVGGQCLLQYDTLTLALGLGFVGLVLWCGLTYVVVPRLMEARDKPSLEQGINGGWLLAVVGTQAVCVLACLLAGRLAAGAAGPVLFAALAFWSVGGVLYVWLMVLIFYRCLFLPLAPRELTPAYWINMGAMAISTLAGVLLVREAGRLELLRELLPFLKGVTVVCWATATWWIPALLALGAWRHLRRRYPLAYDPGYWAAVFPLGMYTVCTQQLVAEFRLPFLAPIPAVFVWVALAAWCATFAGLLAHLAGLRAARPEQEDQDPVHREGVNEPHPA